VRRPILPHEVMMVLLTAVYDISARTVYLPNGLRLEAHSGFGSTKDDPRHVSERGVGATPAGGLRPEAPGATVSWRPGFAHDPGGRKYPW